MLVLLRLRKYMNRIFGLIIFMLIINFQDVIPSLLDLNKYVKISLSNISRVDSDSNKPKIDNRVKRQVDPSIPIVTSNNLIYSTELRIIAGAVCKSQCLQDVRRN
ncbi:unnamed protein product [Heterobilharzia americana]|nr:unnamed protein product [Heterobilharzia americana]